MGASMLEHLIITEGSTFLEIRQKNSLTEIEQKIVLAMVSMVNSTDEEDKIYELYIQEFYDMLGIQGLDKNFQFKEIVEELMSKVVEIPRENGGWVMTHWISSINYIEDSEVVHFRLSSVLKPYFLQLKTSLRL